MTAASPSPSAAPPQWPNLPASIWRAPLVPLALVVTAGIIFDRQVGLPVAGSLVAGAACLLAWLCACPGPSTLLPLIYLGLAAAALAAAYHHLRAEAPADDIGQLAVEEPRPAQVRGWLDSEPFFTPAPPHNPLRSQQQEARTTAVVRVSQVRGQDEWIEASGRVRLVVPGRLAGMHLGDEVEVVGQLRRPPEPANPGEWDYAASLRDQGIRAVLVVRKTNQGVTRLERGWTGSVRGWLAVVRSAGQQRLEALPEATRGLAAALLLGEGAPVMRAAWDKYKRTGVIHVLVVSGQHLVALALALWWLLRWLAVRQRRGAGIVALLLVSYALLTGGQSPALRAAAVTTTVCLGIILRRPSLPANLFALSWLVVVLVEPADIFRPGCQLSFLAVAVLTWGTQRWMVSEPDPLELLDNESRPAWLRGLRWTGWQVLEAYRVALIVWLALVPLLAFHYHLIPVVGILLGPVVTLLATVALFAGFPLLLAGVGVFGWVVSGCLSWCDGLVSLGDRWQAGHLYVGDVPVWWVVVFYVGLLAVLTQLPLRRRWRWGMPAVLAWLCVGLAGGAARLPADEMRCTFLAVGHGGCVVIELPDGRTLLYDTGTLGGPEVTERQIAPFLWSRGIRRIDEVILSHADLDHFNGLAALLQRFAVGQVTCSPTFALKPLAGVQHTLAVLEQYGIPLRTVKAGDRLAAGEVELRVLHPPAVGPGGSENVRSLVLEIRHAGHVLLLTGDLEGDGLKRVLSLPQHRADVLMAPHHGSAAIDSAALAQWARPRVVVACREAKALPDTVVRPYEDRGAEFLATWPHGAVSVRSHTSGLVVETFVSKRRLVLRTRKEGE